MIRLLVVDDSALIRRLFSEIFTEADGFTVAYARDGLEALRGLHDFIPDVITLDINMPQLDGLACLDRIMIERPCPVVMVSSLTREGAETTLQALELGAVDFLPKPEGAISLRIDELAPALIDKVRAAASARLPSARRLAERLRLRNHASSPAAPKRVTAKRQVPQADGQEPQRLVLVGASTGGPPALDALLEPLEADFPWPILVAQHMPLSFTGPLAARLNRLCALEVMEVDRPTNLAAGCVYIARGDADMLVSRRAHGLVAMPAPSHPAHRWHPSVDRLVDSAMRHVEPSRLVGVLMTGMGDDGAQAMTALAKSGGSTIAEAQSTAIVWGMPGELVRRGGAQFVRPLDEIAACLLEMTGP